MNDYFSITVIVLTGITIASAIEMRLFGYAWMPILASSVVTLFGGTLLSLMVFVKQGLIGVVMTCVAATLLHLVFALTNFDKDMDGRAGYFGDCFIWFAVLSVFTSLGFVANTFHEHVGSAYSISSPEESFIVIFLLFCFGGLVSLVMLLSEVRKLSKMRRRKKRA